MLPLCRYRFSAQLLTPLVLPALAGSRLRGALGFALKALACDCGGERHQPHCRYAQIFEPQHNLALFRGAVPTGWVIQPQGQGGAFEPGQWFSFDLVLIGQLIDQLPLMIAAIERMLQYGLGQENTKHKARARLMAVTLPDEPGMPLVWQPGQEIAPHNAIVPGWGAEVPQRLLLSLASPLALQVKGQPLKPGELTAHALLNSLLRRTDELGQCWLPGWQPLDIPAFQPAVQNVHLHEENCHWVKEQRYSHRQQSKMPLAGVQGQLILSGDLAPFISLLTLGEFINTGRKPAFGLGQYRIGG